MKIQLQLYYQEQCEFKVIHYSFIMINTHNTVKAMRTKPTYNEILPRAKKNSASGKVTQFHLLRRQFFQTSTF